MALATQCPHCHTTFRVAHDQLKLRSGLVRCGSCKEIFNGIEHLLPSETVAATRTPAPVDTPNAPAPAPFAAFAAYTAPAPAAAPPASQAAPAPEAAPEPAPAPAAKAAASDQLDFAYPEIDEDHLAPIPDTVVETHANDPGDGGPVEVAFVETPRKTPLPTPAIVDPEPAHPLHGEAPPPGAAPTTSEEVPPADPLTRMTLIDVDEEGNIPPAPNIDEPDPLDKVMEDFERRPARGKRGDVRRRGGKPYARSPIVAMQEEMPPAEPSLEEPAAEELAPQEPATATYSDAEEPEFIKRERHKRTRGRAVGIAMNLASVLMLLLAVGQGAYIFRDQLAVRVPEARPALQSFCALLDCKLELPEQIEAISIESDQLETLSTRKDTSELTLLLHNAGSVAQGWPELELTLNDNNNVPLARRVFAPQEYLPSGIDPKKGFAANAEQPVKLYFEFADAKPAGYHVGVFYR